MRTVLIALVLFPFAALAQTESPPPDPSSPAPDTVTSTTLVDDRDEAPLPEKILAPPSAEAEPAVSIRTDSSGDVVEEYRQNGKVYMVKVRPEKGVPYTIMDTNGDGRLDDSDGDGPVRPVYYTLYEWN